MNSGDVDEDVSVVFFWSDKVKVFVLVEKFDCIVGYDGNFF